MLESDSKLPLHVRFYEMGRVALLVFFLTQPACQMKCSQQLANPVCCSLSYPNWLGLAREACTDYRPVGGPLGFHLVSSGVPAWKFLGTMQAIGIHQLQTPCTTSIYNIQHLRSIPKSLSQQPQSSKTLADTLALCEE